MPNYQIIEIETPTEQSKTVQYGDRTIKFNIRWNDKTNKWFLDLYENDKPIDTGITLATNSNLLYKNTGLGGLYLIDTMYGQTSNPIVKEDLGTRLILMRDYTEA